MTRLFLLSQLLLLVLVVGGAAAEDSNAKLIEPIHIGGIDFYFASAEQGRQLLGRRDPFVDQMSPFDRQVRMRTERDQGTDAYLQFVADEVLDWTDETRSVVRKALQRLDQPLSKIELPKIGPVVLVHTTGREESGAAYTRGSTIVLPRGQTGSANKPKHRLLAHELFHVLSRGNPELRDRLYQNIGFRYVGQIRLPNDFADRRITNPDAPVVEHVIDLQISDGVSVTVSPVLFSETPFDPQQKRSLFGYLKFRLMEVHAGNRNRWEPTLVDGQPVLHDPALPDFHRQIGMNTRYIIHPDEILADNFALWVTDGKVQDQWVIDAMLKTLLSSGQPAD